MVMKRVTAFIVLILVAIVPGLAFAQSAATISGKITDATNGSPLPGANVLLKGTSIGSSTDLNGNYSIPDVPTGSYTVRVSYIGYKTLEVPIEVKKGERVKGDFKLEAVAVKGREVVVTAQASGQNAAINEQLSSNRIMNAVSSARIQQLPDANAAESVGRLPGVYLLRSGGEGDEIAIRGLQPKYNEVMIDGVKMPATSSGDRSTDLSMISSDMLSGIELYKTVTPDMDAAVLGGVVNFQIAEAKRTSSGLPSVTLSVQGGYNNLQNTYKDYKVAGGVGDRFLDNRFGILVQGVAENVTLSSYSLGGSYYLLAHNYGVNNPMALQALNLTYTPRARKRYDASVTMDYKLPNGKIDFVNFFSNGDTKSDSYEQSYGLLANTINYDVGYSANRLNVLTNLLDVKQNISSYQVDVKLSNSFTENVNPGSWGMNFTQNSANLSTINVSQTPVNIAQAALQQMELGGLDFQNFSVSNSYYKHRDLTASIDVQKAINLSDLITATLKFGGMYKDGSAFYGYNDGTGELFAATDVNARRQVLEVYPWLTQPPYNLNSGMYFPMTAFLSPNFQYRNILGGSYTLGSPVNMGFISQVIGTVIDSSRGLPAVGGGTYPFAPDVFGSGASNYTGNEYESAGYIMATLNIGSRLTIIPGVRYQGLKTSYTAPWYFNASAPNPYPLPLTHIDTTINEYHGYWLPDLIVRYRPTSWFDIRAAYTNTLSYPDPTQITPVIDVYYSSNPSATWHNFDLKPAHSQNYDLALSVFNNSIGLLSVDGFLKQIDDLIFGSGGVYITDPSLYPGLPSNTKGFLVNTSINNPYRVNLWGTEVDWQTHFWYLPWALSGLVLNVNYTHIFSGAKYPYVVTRAGTYPAYIPTHIDTFYTDRLIDQPSDIVNLSVGYDYKGFSIVVSMIYQSNVFSGTNFWPQLRSDKANYLRWDTVIKQDLPWTGLQAYLNLNNINGASDIYVVQGSGFPTSESDYGMTADLGLRWTLQ
jgi:TonB-dependent receptor